MAAAAIYKGNFFEKTMKETLIANHGLIIELHGNPDGTIPATFEIIYMVRYYTK